MSFDVLLAATWLSTTFFDLKGAGRLAASNSGCGCASARISSLGMLSVWGLIRLIVDVCVTDVLAVIGMEGLELDKQVSYIQQALRLLLHAVGS